MRTTYTKAVAATFEEAVRQQKRRILPSTVKIPDAWQRELYERLKAGNYGRGSPARYGRRTAVLTETGYLPRASDRA